MTVVNGPYITPTGTTTITVASSGANFTSVSAALASISGWVIPQTSEVVISVSGESYSLTQPIAFSHPYGQRVAIQGSGAATASITSVASFTGSAGNYSATLNVNSTTGARVGGYALVRSLTGTGPFYIHGGVWRITAVGAGTVTLANTCQKGSLPGISVSSGAITYINTVLSFGGCDGFQIGSALGSIDGLVVVGNNTSGTVGVVAQRMGTGFIDNAHVALGLNQQFGISAFGDGGVYAGFCGAVDGENICVAGCGVYGILAQFGGAAQCQGAISNGNPGAGFAASTGGSLYAESAIGAGNGQQGFYAFAAGALLAKSGFGVANVFQGARSEWSGGLRADLVTLSYNGDDGIFCADGGGAIISNGSVSHNAGHGVHTQGGGSIQAGSITSSNNSLYGFFADGGVIDCPISTASNNSQVGFGAANGAQLLTDQFTASSNTTADLLVQSGAYIRATSGTSAGTIHTTTGGIIDLTGASGGFTLTADNGGSYITSTGFRSSSNGIGIGVAPRDTNLSVQKDSTSSSELSAAMILANNTTATKMLVGGFDAALGAYFQALNSGSGYLPLYLNPNGGDVHTGGTIRMAQNLLASTTISLQNGSGASTGTLTNAPSAGNPTKWVPVDDNGTTRYMPLW